jgi:hypothetical protein
VTDRRLSRGQADNATSSGKQADSYSARLLRAAKLADGTIRGKWRVVAIMDEVATGTAYLNTHGAPSLDRFCSPATSVWVAMVAQLNSA